MIRIEIVANTLAELMAEFDMAVDALNPSKTVQGTFKPEAKAEVPRTEAEVVDPPKKPGRPRKQPETIEAKAELVATADPSPAIDEPKVLDFDKDIRPAVIKFVNDVAAKTPDDPDAKKKVFDALIGAFDVKKVGDIPAEKFAALMEYITEKSA